MCTGRYFTAAHTFLLYFNISCLLKMTEIRYFCSISWVVLLFLSTSVLGVPVHKITTSGPSCSVPSPSATPKDIECAPNTTATLEDARALAWKYAPVLKFHPLEPYHLQVRLRWHS